MRKITIGIIITFVIGLTLLLFVTVTPGNGNQQAAGDDLTQEEVEKGLDLQNNGAEGTYVVNLISGNFEGEVEGQVLTDKDCEHDEYGISSCHNDIKLSNENEITVVNRHKMKKNRCLSHRETVKLSRNEDGKVAVDVKEV